MTVSLPPRPRPAPGPLPGPLPRLEDRRLVDGSASFVADLIPRDAVHARFVRSPAPCGTIVDIDVTGAARSPGVVAIYTAAELDLGELPAPPVGGRSVTGMDMPMLASERVSYVGQPVAVIVAGTAVQAADAAPLVFVDVDEGQPVLSPLEAESGSLVHPAAGSNIVLRELHSAGPDPVGEDLVDVSVVVDHPRLAPSPMEPLAVLAVPDGEGIHMHVGVQSPHQVRDQLARVLGLEPSKIRLSVPEVGGAFGMKRFYPEYAVVARAALLLQRPVAWVQERRELFLTGTHGRGQRHEVTLTATPGGRVLRARFRLTTDVGAYPHRGAQVGLFSRLVATGLYDIPRVEFDLLAAVTNLPPTGPYRGAGRPEAAMAIERAMDALARRLDIDPAELRKRNLISTLPHQTPTGAVHDSGDYREALERALELADYDGVRDRQARLRESGVNPIGIGIGAFVERAGGAPDSWEYGLVEICPTGTLVARTGSTSSGQGHETAWRRVVAEAFDVDPRSVELFSGDTSEVADSTGSFASRSAQVGASALWRCAEQVRSAAAGVAAHLLEASLDDLVVSGGRFHVGGVPGSGVTMAEIAGAAAGLGVDLVHAERYSPGAQTFPYGVHVAVVEVDLETGFVKPLQLVAVDDVGTVLDEMLVDGQVRGSVMQGLGAALFEAMRFDSAGQPLTVTFADYLIPSSHQDTPLVSHHVVHPAPSNPLGAKGAGESGCIGMPAAIVNAALDALAPYGVSDLQMPLTSGRVWKALQEAAERPAAARTGL